MTFGDIYLFIFVFVFVFGNEIGFVTYNALPKVLLRKISLPKGPTIFFKKTFGDKTISLVNIFLAKYMI